MSLLLFRFNQQVSDSCLLDELLGDQSQPVICLVAFHWRRNRPSHQTRGYQTGTALWPRAAHGGIVRLYICNRSSLAALFVVGALAQLVQIACKTLMVLLL